MEIREVPVATGDEVSPAAAFTYNQEFAAKYLDNLAQYPIRKRICICGHPINSHHFSPVAGYSCTPGNIWCRCAHPSPVFFASDARLFLRSTNGVGVKHALGTGIAALEKRSGTGTWLVELICAVNDCKNPEITVACVDEEGRVMDKSTRDSVFLCHKHAWDLGGWRLA
jgi:hypothetical protein